MSDPSLLPEGTGEVAKFGGSGIVGGLITMLLGRLFKSQDKASEQILAELKSLHVSVAALTQQVAVMTSGNSRLERDVAQLQLASVEQGKEISALQATVKSLESTLTQIREGLIE